jgi:hypothetical protein
MEVKLLTYLNENKAVSCEEMARRKREKEEEEENKTR